MVCVVPKPLPGLNYSTTFPLTENPISESGKWQSPNTAPWTSRVRTTGGNAIGDPAASSTNDAIACLVGAYYKNQKVTAKMFIGGALTGAEETELHVLTTFSGANIFTYEMDMAPALTAIFAFVKWQGAQGLITVLPFINGTTGNYVGNTCSDGDIFEFSVVDENLSPASLLLTLKQNGTIIAQARDTLAISGTAPYTNGTPGIGFDNGGANNANCGWADYAAVTTP